MVKKVKINLIDENNVYLGSIEYDEEKSITHVPLGSLVGLKDEKTVVIDRSSLTVDKLDIGCNLKKKPKKKTSKKSNKTVKKPKKEKVSKKATENIEE